MISQITFIVRPVPKLQTADPHAKKKANPRIKRNLAGSHFASWSKPATREENRQTKRRITSPSTAAQVASQQAAIASTHHTFQHTHSTSRVSGHWIGYPDSFLDLWPGTEQDTRSESDCREVESSREGYSLPRSHTAHSPPLPRRSQPS